MSGSRPIVRPRASLVVGGASLPLDRLINDLIERNQQGVIYILGPTGSGKSTALEHLRNALAPRPGLELFDEPAEPYWELFAEAPLAIVATSHQDQPNSLAILHLSPWTDDDLIEYVVATHRAQAKSIMQRVLSDADRYALEGSPELWVCVIEQMAREEKIATSIAGLRAHLARKIALGPLCESISSLCFQSASNSSLEPTKNFPAGTPAEVLRLLRHRIVQFILAADHLAERLCNAREESALFHPLPRLLINEVGRLLSDRASAVRRLEQLILNSEDDRNDAMAASIMVAHNPSWRPVFCRCAELRDARLEGAQWAGISLPGAHFTFAKLAGADLNESVLHHAHIGAADLSDVRLIRADLREVRAYETNFTGCILDHANASKAFFSSSNFTGARLRYAKMNGANFRQTVLVRADFSHAQLPGADFTDADVSDADFSYADLTGGILHCLDFTTAICDHAIFTLAQIQRCNLEGLALEMPNFEQADLRNSYLTGSRFTDANFYKADLRNTGLADIDWSGADLREADLRGCSFHLGSTRSGLVGSTIPCEGSRTGFYTDDYVDQDFKAPEEIRKANLTNADLRGANIDGVDFYLVDLRNARYTPAQAKHLARTGAILHSRVA